jgi:hypothetical protein
VASVEVLTSKKFPQLIELLLEIGNYLNDGTPRGGVFGFKISSLNKLADTKSTDNTTSLTNFLVRYLEQSAPRLLDFPNEVAHAEAASRISLAQMQTDVNSLQRDHAAIVASLEGFKDRDKHADQMMSFLDKCRADLEAIDSSFKLMLTKYHEALQYLGEEKSTQPDEFFNHIHNFGISITEAVKQNKQNAVDEEKAKKREEAKAKRVTNIIFFFYIFMFHSQKCQTNY